MVRVTCPNCDRGPLEVDEDKEHQHIKCLVCMKTLCVNVHSVTREEADEMRWYAEQEPKWEKAHLN